jgi:ABC-type transporter Mla subunit MlaD
MRSPLLGSKALEIIPGGKDMPVLANGSYIWSVDSDEGARIMAEKAKSEKPDEITRILQNVEQLTYNLSAAEGSLEQTLHRISAFFTYLNSEEESFRLMLAQLDEITRRIEQKEGSIGKFMDDNYELYNSTVSMMQKLNLVLDDFRTLSKTMADASPELKAAIERSNRTMDEAIGLMKTLNQNFFVRGFSSRKVPEAVPIENAEREGGY